MSKGGARARSGPPPDPNSLVQADGEWTILPAEGRAGDAPAWPLVSPSTRELELWVSEWTRPQAVIWDSTRQEVTVAMYVRVLAGAELHDAKVTERTLLKQLAEDLGISQSGMLRNRWRIAEAETEQDRPASRPSSRDRLKVVGGVA